MTLEDFDVPAVLRREDGAHAGIGLERGDVGDTLGELAGEEAGAGADLEGVGGAGGEEPVEGVLGRGGAKPVVVVGDRSEGLGEDGRFLVLLHAIESTENCRRWGRRRSGVPERAGEGGVQRAFDVPGGALELWLHAEVAQR